MALQDLTPQLRTRLGRLERAVGVFVALATLILVAGFAYYIRHTAEKRGWFKTKVTYFTFVNSAVGLNVGDPVKLMGFDVGEITRIEAQPPDDSEHNVYVEFVIKKPYYGYLWTSGSKARVASADFLGKRTIEVTKGTGGEATYLEEYVTNWFFGVTNGFFGRVHKEMKVWDDKAGVYRPITNGTKYWLLVKESPALTERLEGIVKTAEEALPSILNLTNQLAATLNNGNKAMSNANRLLTNSYPMMSNLVVITTQLTNHEGALGEWLIPTNIKTNLELTLVSATKAMTNASNTMTNADKTIKTAKGTLLAVKQTVTNVNAHLDTTVSNLNVTLVYLSNITSNLNAQVQANTNILTEISTIVTNADNMIQGLKHHWLLRSAFKDKKPEEKKKDTNAPPREPIIPRLRQH